MTFLEDDLVYHYTNCESFLSIVKSNSLWASDLEALNDPAELYTARGLLHNIFAVYREPSGFVASAIQQAIGLEYLPPRWKFAGQSELQLQRFAQGAVDYLLRHSAESHWDSANWPCLRRKLLQET